MMEMSSAAIQKTKICCSKCEELILQKKFCQNTAKLPTLSWCTSDDDGEDNTEDSKIRKMRIYLDKR